MNIFIFLTKKMGNQLESGNFNAESKNQLQVPGLKEYIKGFQKDIKTKEKKEVITDDIKTFCKKFNASFKGTNDSLKDKTTIINGLKSRSIATLDNVLPKTRPTDQNKGLAYDIFTNKNLKIEINRIFQNNKTGIAVDFTKKEPFSFTEIEVKKEPVQEQIALQEKKIETLEELKDFRELEEFAVSCNNAVETEYLSHGHGDKKSWETNSSIKLTIIIIGLLDRADKHPNNSYAKRIIGAKNETILNFKKTIGNTPTEIHVSLNNFANFTKPDVDGNPNEDTYSVASLSKIPLFLNKIKDLLNNKLDINLNKIDVFATEYKTEIEKYMYNKNITLSRYNLNDPRDSKIIKALSDNPEVSKQEKFTDNINAMIDHYKLPKEVETIIIPINTKIEAKYKYNKKTRKNEISESERFETNNYIILKKSHSKIYGDNRSILEAEESYSFINNRRVSEGKIKSVYQQDLDNYNYKFNVTSPFMGWKIKNTEYLYSEPKTEEGNNQENKFIQSYDDLHHTVTMSGYLIKQ